MLNTFNSPVRDIPVTSDGICCCRLARGPVAEPRFLAVQLTFMIATTLGLRLWLVTQFDKAGPMTLPVHLTAGWLMADRAVFASMIAAGLVALSLTKPRPDDRARIRYIRAITWVYVISGLITAVMLWVLFLWIPVLTIALFIVLLIPVAIGCFILCDAT